MRKKPSSEEKLALIQGRKCDKYDYLIAVGCGAIAGLVDIFLVGAPGNSALGSWTDTQVDYAVMAFAKKAGWSDANGKGISSAVGYLERNFKVNYDQRHTFDVAGAFQMSTKNHHLKSLAHSPDPVGLFFSILDQFQGKASFIDHGQIIRIDTSNSDFELRGSTFHAKLFCGFCNWIGHIMSDIAGSSGSIGNGGRGSGLAIPFYELFLLCDFGSIQIGKDRQSFADLMTRVFQEGYDARFGLTMSIPVLLTELFIRAAWALKQHYYHHEPWEKCIPSGKHADLRWMLIVGNATLCLFDGADALIRSGGNPILFVLRLNLIAWFKLILMILKEICIRFGFNYADLAEELKKINTALDQYLSRLKAIDYAAYERELSELRSFHRLLQDTDADTGQIYLFLEQSGASMQFYSFEEFDQRMMDDSFVLEI